MRGLIVILASLAISSCQTTPSASQASEAPGDVCPSHQDTIHVGLAQVEGGSLAEIGEVLQSEYQVRPVVEIGATRIPSVLRQPGQHIRLLLEICLDSATEDLHLRRAQFMYHFGVSITIESFSHVAGLEEAVFGNGDGLKIVGSSRAELIIHSMGGKVYAALAKIRGEAAETTLETEVIAFGTLVPGVNPFSTLLCDRGSPVRETYRFGAVTLAAIRCRFPGGGGLTTMYVTKHISILDPSGGDLVLRAEDIDTLREAGLFMERINHHNSCDSVSVSTPDPAVFYAWTGPPFVSIATPADSCPQSVVDGRAPVRERGETPEHEAQIKYHVNGLVGFAPRPEIESLPDDFQP